ncbi:MAG: hypothetical protein ACYTGC_15115 [Planctomycetota bacterium]|jgi:hypothetical protein
MRTRPARQDRRASSWHRLLWLPLVALALMLPASSLAQHRVRDGRQLDSNLRVGSNGYNTRTAQRVAPQRQIYTLNRAQGTFVYSRNNAFAPRSRYGLDSPYSSQFTGSHTRRFRY